VGEVVSETSVTSASGTDTDVPDGVAAWDNYINTHGGINGHPLKLIVMDDRNDPATSLSDVQTLVSNDHVVAILDGSAQDATWVNVVTPQKVPVIGLDTSGGGFQFQTQPDYFAGGTTVLTILWGQMKAASVAGAKTYALLYCSELPACAQAAPATKGLAPSIPITVSYVAKVSNAQPNYTAQCLGAQQAGVKAVFPAGVDAARVADGCAQQGYKPIWVTSNGSVSAADIKDPNMASAVGDLEDVPWMLDNTPALRRFHQIEDPVLNKAQSQAFVEFSYVGAQLFQTAAIAGISATDTSPSSQDVLNGLYGLKNETLGGMAPPLNFAPGKANPVSCVFLYGIKNGTFAATFGSQMYCQPS
jgi:branched-chain amino acid transport system substrate-binding protein